MRTPVWKTRSTSTHFVIWSKAIESDRSYLSAYLFSCLFRLFSVQFQQRTSEWTEVHDHRSLLVTSRCRTKWIDHSHPFIHPFLSNDTRPCFSTIFRPSMPISSWHAGIRRGFLRRCFIRSAWRTHIGRHEHAVQIYPERTLIIT